MSFQTYVEVGRPACIFSGAYPTGDVTDREAFQASYLLLLDVQSVRSRVWAPEIRPCVLSKQNILDTICGFGCLFSLSKEILYLTFSYLGGLREIGPLTDWTHVTSVCDEKTTVSWQAERGKVPV